MRPNLLKNRIDAGERTLNAWCSIPSSYTAEAIAGLGFDSVTIDLQHGPIDDATAFQMLQAISTSRSTPLVRVPWNDPAVMMRMLDAGAYGLICPMINTRAQAEAFVAACRYPPGGYRSFGPNRAVPYSGVRSAAEYAARADGEIILLAMIETRLALDNLDDILSVPGLDGVYLGPGDLSLSMGEAPSMRPQAASVQRAIETIVTAARSRKLIAAAHTDGPKTAQLRFSQGFQLCTLQTDFRFMLNGAAAALEAARGEQPI